MKQLPIKDFKYGLIDSIESQSIPRGASSRCLNFLNSGTKLELRRGSSLLGNTENTGIGKITGLGVAKKPNGDDIIYRTRKRKIEYLDTSTNDWVEAGSDVMSSDVLLDDTLGEDISIEPYQNPTGPQIWFNSKGAGPLKIMTANPGSVTDMYTLGTNYKGKMRIKGGRMYVWDRFGNPSNKTDLFASQLNYKADSDYTQITAEAIAASGTLAFKGAGAKRVCFQLIATVGLETFTDNGDGTLTGSLGGTGYINYTTGVYSGLGVGTIDYRWADDTATKGIANFTYSSTRTSGEGFILPQATGNDFKNLMSLNGREYCFHKNATWVVTISADDLDVTNLIYRSKAGISNFRAACESGDGVYFIDDSDENDIHFRILRLESTGTEVVPQSISKQFKIADVKVGVNLNDYYFDFSSSIEFGDFVLFACRTKNSLVNNRVFVYNKVNKATNILDYNISCFAIYEGALVAGDSVSDNVFVLFSGITDNESQITGFWESNLDNLGVSGTKKVIEIIVAGEIGSEQSAKISMSVDRGPFVEVRSKADVANNKHAVEGKGDYVDRTQAVTIGSFTLGRGEIGGGGSGISAFNYRRMFRIVLDKFEHVMFRVEPTGIGYFSLTEFTYADVRIKSSTVSSKYRTNR